MISLFTRLTLPVCLLCAAMTISLMGIGTRLTASPHTSVLTSNPCALPCIFGIIPGVTVRDGLPEMFANVPVSYLSYDSTRKTYALQQQDPLSSLLVLLNFGSPDDETVRSAQIYQTSSEPVLGTLSDFLLAGYRPTRVFTDCQNAQQIVIMLDDQPLFTQVALRQTFKPNAPVMLVGAGSDAAAVERAIYAFGCAAERRWMGFALLWKYLPAS